MNTLPSYAFAALGIALVILGGTAFALGDGTGERIAWAAVVVIGIVQVVFGGLRRKTEDGSSARQDKTPAT